MSFYGGTITVTSQSEMGTSQSLLKSEEPNRLRVFWLGSYGAVFLLAVALGKPREKVVVETLKPDGDVKYWRDSGGVHHVPKRGLDVIILGSL